MVFEIYQVFSGVDEGLNMLGGGANLVKPFLSVKGYEGERHGLHQPRDFVHLVGAVAPLGSFVSSPQKVVEVVRGA